MVVGDIGTVFSLTIKERDTGVVIDLTGASSLTIVFARPSADDVSVVGTAAAPATGVVTYTTDGTEFDVGHWSARAVVVLPAGTWTSDRFWFFVLAA